MAPERKLSDQQVKTIRRRCNQGEQLSALALALAYGVNRKTLRRRLDALAQKEAERAQRIAATRLCRQAAAERQKLQARLGIVPPAHDEAAPQTERVRPRQPAPRRDPLRDWLERPKNLSGRALPQASGRVRVSNPDGSIQRWVELSLVDGLLEQGWTLA